MEVTPAQIFWGVLGKKINCLVLNNSYPQAMEKTVCVLSFKFCKRPGKIVQIKCSEDNQLKRTEEIFPLKMFNPNL